jgi:shikimate dehydrogenase
MIDGKTKLIAHVGYPTESFKAPMIYNPWFEAHGINAAVVPMGCKAEDYSAFFKLLFRLGNVIGALVTMPHKIPTLSLVDEASVSAKVAGACNAVRLDADGKLTGDMFDGEGFVRGVLRKGRNLASARVLVAGNGGVGSAIAASFAKASTKAGAKAGISEIALFDAHAPAMNALAARIRASYPSLKVTVGSNDPAAFDIVVNATPLGMKAGDPLPMDVARISPSALVGEVVMKEEITPFLAAARARGCEVQVGTDMLFEQIPAYLEFFGFGTATADELRKIAKLHY